jgi:phosphoribosyl 1,2-cyclic phosphodiesterase
MATFCSLYSGSSGNCSFVESGGSAILIDAGVSTRSIVKALDSIGSDIKKIAAVFITHEHSDHIKGLITLTSKYKIPVYANGGTIDGILMSLKTLNPDCLFEMKTGESITAGGMKVTSFKTSHDSNESVGYRIHTSDDRQVAVATDLGYVSDEVDSGIRGCKLVLIESNHDVGMLQNGDYPYFLKRRILSKRGHLSNDDCAAILPSLVESGAEHFILAHLSRDNNLPELAAATAISELLTRGIEDGNYELEAAPRLTQSKVYNL